jgi:hypothetical protein
VTDPQDPRRPPRVSVVVLRYWGTWTVARLSYGGDLSATGLLTHTHTSHDIPHVDSLMKGLNTLS